MCATMLGTRLSYFPSLILPSHSLSLPPPFFCDAGNGTCAKVMFYHLCFNYVCVYCMFGACMCVKTRGQAQVFLRSCPCFVSFVKLGILFNFISM